jgi:prepilin-type N-terminal cleavage/methylation domain-containing protein
MNKGFTLIEVIISIGILSGIILVLSIFSFDIFDFGIFLGENVIAQQEIQLTMRNMVAEMRGMSQSVNGAYPVESASQNAIVFFSDRDGDGLAERIRYYLDGSTLNRGVIKPTGNPLTYSVEESITEAVHNIYSAGNIFSYYDLNYSGTQAELSFPVNIPAIRLVKINLTVDPNPGDISSRVNFTNSINVRNL